MLDELATLGHRSAASRATGPRISEPFSSPSAVIITAALSSNWIQIPSGRLIGWACRMTTAGNICFLISGVPLFTATVTISPTQAAGFRLNRPLYPMTWTILSSRAPVLSAQVMIEPIGSPLLMCGRYSVTPLALTALVLGAGSCFSS